MEAIDELVIQIRATAEGVKQGVAVAQGELKKLKANRDELEQALRMEVDSSGITQLRKELSFLQELKKELEMEAKFPVESEGVQQLKKELDVINEKKLVAEETLSIHMELPDKQKVEGELEELKAEKARLEEAIEIQVKADAETAKKRLNDVNRVIAETERGISISLETEGVNEATNALREADQAMQDVEKSSKATSIEMAAIGAVAAKAFYEVLSAVKSGTDAFNEYTATMNGLKSQMDHIGVSMSDALDIIKDKTSDGLVSKSDIAASIKNLTTYGFSIEQASVMLDRLKDSAAYNRQAHYTLGEAVRVTTEGIKNENSTLADAAGVTKNIAKMYEEYAASLGVSANNLTQAQKAQAVYNGVLAETEATIGNATEYTNTLAGAQAEQEAQALKLAQAYGEAMAPAVQTATEAFTVLLGAATEFVNNNKSLVQGVTLGITAYAGLTSVLSLATAGKTALTIATKLFSDAEKEAVATTKGLGAAISTYALPIAAVVTIIAAVAQEMKNYEERQQELNEKISQYNALKNEEISIENMASKQQIIEDIENVISKYDELIAKQNEVKQSFIEFDATFSSMGNYDLIGNGVLRLQAAYKELVEEAEVYGITANKTLSIEDDMARIKGLLVGKLQEEKKAMNEFNKSLKEESSLSALSADGIKKMIKPMQDLNAVHQTLSKGEQLSIETLTELIDLYPEVAKHIADNANWRETLIGVIEDEMNKSKEASLAELQAKKDELIAAKAKLVGVEGLNEQEAASYAAAMADKKAATQDFVNFMANAVNAIKSGEFLSTGLEAIDNAHSKAIKNAMAAIDEELALIDARMKAINMVASGGGGGGSSGGGSSGSGGAAKAQKEVNEALTEALRLHEEKKKLEDMTKAEELAALIEIKAAYANSDQEKIDMDIKIRDVRREMHTEAIQMLEEERQLRYISDEEYLQRLREIQAAYAENYTRQESVDMEIRIKDAELAANDEWYDKVMKDIEKMNRGIAEKTDYQAIINKLQETLDEAEIRYGEGSEKFLKIQEELSDSMTDNAEKRADKLLAITADCVDDSIAEQERLIQKSKNMDGMIINGVEYEHTTEYEKGRIQEEIRINEARIAYLESLERELTEAGQSELDQRLAARKQYAYKIEDLDIAAIKEQQTAEKKKTETLKKELENQAKEEEKANKERIAAMQKANNERIAATQKANKEYIEGIKERYAAELKAAEDAANAEIAIYQDKINAIDNLMKAESRAETDADDQDKLNRLNEQLAYELDEYNIYELKKEIAAKEAEMEKRKRKESLEDQKAALQEQINAVKDSLTAQKEAIQEARDAEVQAAEERQERYAADLEAQTAMLRETEATKTEIVAESLEAQAVKLEETEAANTSAVQGELKTRTEDNKEFLSQKEKQLDDNLREERRIYSRATDNIISDLYLRIPSFRAAGSALGSAFATAYREAVAALAAAAEVQGYSAASDYSSISLASEQTPVVNTYNIDFDQTITTPVASPSKVAQETEYMLEQIIKYV